MASGLIMTVVPVPFCRFGRKRVYRRDWVGVLSILARSSAEYAVIRRRGW